MSLRDYPSQASYGRVGYVVLPVLTGEIESETGAPVKDHGHYVIVRDCFLCGQESRTTVPAQGLWDWEHGAFVQVAFPSLTPGEREQVMNGTHDACFDEAIPEEDEE